MISRLKHFYHNHTREFWVIVIILLIAAFLRLYKIDQYMTFLGDEGRDALVIKKILVDYDFPLLGPVTSVGNIYLGPLYYYMMSIPMAIFWLNPVAAAGFVALIGVLTIGLIYYLARQWFGQIPAITAALLYAISPITIIYSRSSWNPNPAPFFSLMGILGLYLAHKSGNFRYFILTGVAAAFLIQMHYLALIMLPVFLIIWFYELRNRLKDNINLKRFTSSTLIALGLFFLLMSPLLIFDLKYNFQNYNAFNRFFIQGDTTVDLNPLNTFGKVIPIYIQNLNGAYLTNKNPFLTPLISLVILIPLVLVISGYIKNRKIEWHYLVLLVWLLVGVMGLVLYKQTIFSHYILFLSPAPYFLLAAVITLIKNKKLQLVCVALLIIILGLVNLQNNLLVNPPNNQLKKTQEIAKFIIKQTEGQPYNFALISENNYDSAYQFYLDFYGHSPKKLDRRQENLTEQLIIVCEDPICKPVGHPKQEIADFGWTKIEKETNFEGVKIYKLIHNQEGVPVSSLMIN